MKRRKVLRCSKCGKPRKGKARYCAKCHAAYQRKHRAKLKRERAAVAKFLKRFLPRSEQCEQVREAA